MAQISDASWKPIGTNVIVIGVPMDLQAWTSFAITWLIWNQRAGFDFYDSGSVLNFVKQTFFFFFLLKRNSLFQSYAFGEKVFLSAYLHST